MVFELDDTLRFPDPSLGEPDGWIAVGGDLSPQRLLKAYPLGFFPWFSFRDAFDILWYCPQERFVIFPDEVHVSHSMKTLLRKNKYHESLGQAEKV